MSIGKNIKKIREFNQLTQDELANKLFVTRQTISNYENNRSRPDIDMLMKIAEVLNVDIQDILYGTDSIYQKEVKKKLGIGLCLLLIMIIWLYIFKNMKDSYGWEIIVNTQNLVLFYPLLSLIIGWCSIQLIQICFKINSFNFKYKKTGKWIVIIGLSIWLFGIISPLIIDQVIPLILPSWYHWGLIGIIKYTPIYYGLFVSIGALLECFHNSTSDGC